MADANQRLQVFLAEVHREYPDGFGLHPPRDNVKRTELVANVYWSICRWHGNIPQDCKRLMDLRDAPSDECRARRVLHEADDMACEEGPELERVEGCEQGLSCSLRPVGRSDEEPHQQRRARPTLGWPPPAVSLGVGLSEMGPADLPGRIQGVPPVLKLADLATPFKRNLPSRTDRSPCVLACRAIRRGSDASGRMTLETSVHWWSCSTWHSSPERPMS